MTDKEAKKLLDLLRQYLTDYAGDGVNEDMPINEVIYDLEETVYD